MPNYQEECEVLIIGAGPAGTLAAAKLLRLGHDVTILERSSFPRFVIGESLLPRCQDLLAETDLLSAVNKSNFQIKNGAVFASDNEECHFDFSERYSEGADFAWQVERSKFDKVLADEVAKKGAQVQYRCTVKNVDFLEGHQIVQYENNEGKQLSVKSKYVIDASGFGRVLPRMLNLDKPSIHPPRAAVFAHAEVFDGEYRKDSIEVFCLSNDSWCWLIPLSKSKLSIGVVGAINDLADLPGDAEEKLRSQIDENKTLRTKVGNYRFVSPVNEIKGYAIGVKQFYGRGYVLTGNSTEFIDPIFSSGVTLAMESGVQAAKLVSSTLNNIEVNWEKDYVEYIQRGVSVFSSYIKAWYSGELPQIFFASHQLEQFKKQICSVLAGYVWDTTNPMVTKHEKILSTLSKVIKIQQSED